MLNLKEWLNTEECFSINDFELRVSKSDMRQAFFTERLSQRAPRYAPSVKSLYDDYLSDKEEEEMQKKEKQPQKYSSDVQEPDEGLDKIVAKKPEQPNDNDLFYTTSKPKKSKSYPTVYFTTPKPSHETRLYMGKDGLHTHINPDKKNVRFDNPEDFKKYDGKVFNSYGKELQYDSKHFWHFYGKTGKKIMGNWLRNEPFFFDEDGKKVNIDGFPIADTQAKKTTEPEAKKTAAPDSGQVVTTMPEPPPKTPQIDSKTKQANMQFLANELLGSLNAMLTKMIGKTLGAYSDEKKGSDAYYRAAVTLDNYKKALGARYKNWILTNWFGRKVENTETLDEAYNLNDYRNLMYDKAASFYKNWLATPAKSADLDTIKNDLRALGDKKKMDLQQGQMKQISSGEPTLQDLEQFLNLLLKQRNPSVNLNKAQIIMRNINKMSTEELVEFIDQEHPKFRSLAGEIQDVIDKPQSPSAITSIGVAGAAATAVAGALSGGTLLAVGALNTALAMYMLYKEKSVDTSKKVLAEKYLRVVNQAIAALGKRVVKRYVGKSS